MISKFKLSAAPRNVAIRALGGREDRLTELVLAGKVRSFRGRGGRFLFDVATYLEALERYRLQLQGPHRIYWRDDPDAKGPPPGVASGRK